MENLPPNAPSDQTSIPPASVEKVESSEPAEFINIRVMDQRSGEVEFKLRKTTPFSKLFAAYAERQALLPNTLRYLFDGNRLRGEQTPKSVDMEEGDMVDAVVAQVGGC